MNVGWPSQPEVEEANYFPGPVTELLPSCQSQCCPNGAGLILGGEEEEARMSEWGKTRLEPAAEMKASAG